MTDFLFWLDDEQWAEIEALLQRSESDSPDKLPVPRSIDDRVAISGIIYVLRSGRAWRDAPPAYGPYLSLVHRYFQLKKAGNLDKIRSILEKMPGADQGAWTSPTKVAAASLESALLQAVVTADFELHYQPQISLKTGRVIAFEALLRWQHPTWGGVLPEQFISLAEEQGFITDLGKEILNRACVEATRWPEDIGVAVNVSALQLRDGTFPDIVATALKNAKLKPSRLELEITESYALADQIDEAFSVLHELHTMGVRLAIDDFGRMHTSMTSLLGIHFDCIKIDRSFVSRLGAPGKAGETALRVVEAIIGLCTKLNIVCTAEGIETEFQLSALRARGCSRAQGYLIGAAVPPSECASLLKKRTPMAEVLVHDQPMSKISFSQIIETVNDVVIITTPDLDPPGPAIVYVNPAFEHLTGYQASEVIGRSPRILQGPRTDRATLDRIRRQLEDGLQVREKIFNYAKDGAPYWLDMRIVPIRDDRGAITYFAAIERDITLDKRRYDELVDIADRDTLTGIPNRRALLRTIEAAIKRVRLNGTPPKHCLAIIDVDHFKNVNDVFGHAAGDAVLLGLADRIASNLRRMDTLGRLGGEEFAIWMSDVTLRDGKPLAERIRRSVAAAPFETTSGPLSVTVTIGVAALKPGEDIESLMRHADEALYAAKRAGRNRVGLAVVPPGINGPE